MTAPDHVAPIDISQRFDAAAAGDLSSRLHARFRNDAAMMVAIFAIAAVVRLAFALLVSDSANLEGIYYLRLGENLAAGRGYIGLRENGLQLLYPPLFPGLIAAGTMLTGHAELFARAVDLVLGASLVIPVFLIARLYFRREVAVVAALLIALQPYLIAMSDIVLSETLYLLLILGGLYAALLAARSGSWRSAAASGLCFGGAYLTRPEGIVLAILAAMLLIAVQRRPARRGLGAAALLLAVTALLAAPYVVWLTRSTGMFLFEGKSADNYATESQFEAGVRASDIFFGINDDLSPRGTSMASNLEIIQTWKTTPAVAARFALSRAPRLLPVVATRLLSARILGGPTLALFALLGLAIGLSRRDTWLVHIVLGGAVVWSAVALLMAPLQAFPTRYLLPFVPPFLIWAALGIVTLSHWAAAAYARLMPQIAPSRLAALRVGALTVFALPLVALPLTAIAEIDELRQDLGDNHAQKEAGLWLKTHPGAAAPRLRIMDTSATAAYYAGGVLVPFPSASAAQALRFIEAQHVDVVILSSRAAGARSYLRDWIEHGYPERGAIEIHRERDPLGGQVVVYRRGS